jgi:ABC-type multidrug transport system ATPase subunit
MYHRTPEFATSFLQNLRGGLDRETLITGGCGLGFYTHRKAMPTKNNLQAEETVTALDLTAPAVELNRVSRLYGSFVALREITVMLAAGSSVVMLGENGAGKSTLLKVIAGLASPSYGTVSVFGENSRDQRGRVAYMSHSTMLYDELTGLENLTYFGSLHTDGASRGALQQQAAEALLEVGLEPSNTRRVGEYSQGMRQRASLARVLLSEPDLLLLDEPFSNLDVGSAQSMIARLLDYVAQPSSSGLARTLLLTTHQAELARPLAQSTLTLSGGRLVSLIETAA